MKMMLVVDSGSTKADWFVACDKDGKGRFLSSPGINCITTPDHEIETIISNIKRDLEEFLDINLTEAETTVYFYGAGCLEGESSKRIARSFQNILGSKVEVFASSDMIGASRALFGNNAGIACILGTGSNSCLFNGNSIIGHVPPLGYILGDEGSGTDMGKRLLNAYFKGFLSDSLMRKLNGFKDMKEVSVIENVYRGDRPNVYLASFMPFIKENQDHYPELKNIVRDSISDFFKKNICRYSNYNEFPIGFVGSVAFFFSETLQEVASDYRLKIHNILRRPIESLGDYHKQEI